MTVAPAGDSGKKTSHNEMGERPPRVGAARKRMRRNVHAASAAMRRQRVMVECSSSGEVARTPRRGTSQQNLLRAGSLMVRIARQTLAENVAGGHAMLLQRVPYIAGSMRPGARAVPA